MRTLSQVLRDVEKFFRNDAHLDLEPFAEPQLRTPAFASSATAVTTGGIDILEDPQLDTQVRDELLYQRRKAREAELAVPVTAIEIELVDNFIVEEGWNITHTKVDNLIRSSAFKKLAHTAYEKGFSFMLETSYSGRSGNRNRVQIFLKFRSFKCADHDQMDPNRGRLIHRYEHP
jgi:hypothetical protein